MLNELHKRDAKNYRIREHMYLMYAYYKYQFFLTFTFNNEHITLKSDTRRQKVRRTLNKIIKKYDGLYIANIDYGSENEREHYHALICLNEECPNLTKELQEIYDYGFIKVKNANTNISALSKYINKFSNHAQKSSVRNEKVIYSEGFTTLQARFKAFNDSYYDLKQLHKRHKLKMLQKA